MSLYSDLNEVLTPYAQRIKGLGSQIGEVNESLDAQAEAIADLQPDEYYENLPWEACRTNDDYPSGWRTGYYKADGTASSSNYFIRTTARIYIDKYERIELTPPEPYAIGALCYYEDGTYDVVGHYDTSVYPDYAGKPLIIDVSGNGYISANFVLGKFASGDQTTSKEFIATIETKAYQRKTEYADYEDKRKKAEGGRTYLPIDMCFKGTGYNGHIINSNKRVFIPLLDFAEDVTIQIDPAYYVYLYAFNRETGTRTTPGRRDGEAFIDSRYTWAMTIASNASPEPDYVDFYNLIEKVWIADANTKPDTYYDDEMADTVDKVKGLMQSPSLVFPLITDIHHYKSGDKWVFSRMASTLKGFVEKVKCDFLACMGDLIEGDATQPTSLIYAKYATAFLDAVGIRYIFSEGNHDNNPYASASGDIFSLSQCFEAFYASADKADRYNLSEGGTDFYVDYPALGVRVISLNACNVKVARTYAYGSTTAGWLTNALDTDYTVILIEHLSSIKTQVWNQNNGTNSNAITTAITDFVNGGGKLIQLSGHSHVDLAFVSPWLSIMQVCTKFEKADTSSSKYQEISGYIDEMGAPDRTLGTPTEQAWSACVYRPIEDDFSMIRFGAGSDRYFHITPIEPTTVTSKLTDVTWSTSDATVATVSGGVITGVGSGRCAILAKDIDGNYECWIVIVN